jgi:hypothetical protein
MVVFKKIPEKIRMIIIAVLGSFIGWLTYELIYLINPMPHAGHPAAGLQSFLLGQPVSTHSIVGLHLLTLSLTGAAF